MMDTVSKRRRSEIMGRIRSKDTTPEILVRSLVHRLGYRFRLYYRSLPGCPDIVFPSRRKAIFINGCFFHRHKGCPSTRTPKTRVRFWREKFAANVRRDAAAKRGLTRMGWRYMVIWECEAGKADEVAALAARIRCFLEVGD